MKGVKLMMNWKTSYIRFLKKLQVIDKIRITVEKYYNGHNIKIPLINGIGYSNIFLKPSWINELFDRIRLTDEDTVIDVGANIGQTLIGVKTAKRNISYIGFEPNIFCAYYLSELIKVNNFRDCIVQNFALYDRIDHLILEKNYDDDPRGSIVEQLRPDYFGRKDLILAIDYDRLGLNRKISLVKIDVEGSEYEVLVGMNNMIVENQPIIICEVLDSHSEAVLHFTQSRAAMVCSFLKTHNYSILQIKKNIEFDMIESYEKIDSIEIKQWTPESRRVNDYLFLPDKWSGSATSMLNSLCD